MKLRDLMKTIKSQLIIVDEKGTGIDAYKLIYQGYSAAVKDELDDYLDREVETVLANKDSLNMLFENEGYQVAYLSILLK